MGALAKEQIVREDPANTIGKPEQLLAARASGQGVDQFSVMAW